MERLHIVAGRAARPLAAGEPMRADGYVWVVAVYDEADELAAEVQCLTGARLYEDHVDDVKNLAHPSSFDSTEDYELVIFRGRLVDRVLQVAPLAVAAV